MNDTEIKVELARMDERLKALLANIAHNEGLTDTKLKLAADEIARRLEELNHAHQRDAGILATYLPRETAESEFHRLSDRIGNVQTKVAELEILTGQHKQRTTQNYLTWGIFVAAIGMTIGIAGFIVNALSRR